MGSIPVAPASTYYNIILEILQSMIWLPVVGNYADIDVYASILAYEILLNQRGKPARNYIPVAPNYSVPTDLRLPELEHKTFDFNSTTDQIIILDISKPETIHKFAKDDQILEIIDHHPGYEEYWQTHIGKRAIIEPIGAVATSIFEWWGECWDYGKMPSEIAKLLLGAILDNTLNFNADITTPRDRKAAKELTKILNTTIADFANQYFSAVSQTIEQSLKSSIVKDIKQIKISATSPEIAFGQLTLWNAKNVSNKISEIRQIISSISPSYLISIISISEKQNYILTSSLELDNYLTQLLHLKSQNNWLVSDQLYLRKEIIAKLLTTQTQESI